MRRAARWGRIGGSSRRADARSATGRPHVDNSLLSADLKNNQAVKSADVANENLTGADIADKSGIGICEISVRIVDLCFRAENANRVWEQALAHCANLDMRLPTIGEAAQLAGIHDLPNIADDESFWTSDFDLWSQFGGAAQLSAWIAWEDGHVDPTPHDVPHETACVTDPTN